MNKFAQSFRNDLLDFMAEKFLNGNNNINYIRLSGLPAFSTFLEGKKYLILPVEQEESIGNVDLKEFENVLIPVLKEEQKNNLIQQVQEVGLAHVEVYHLSIVERYTFYSRQFMKSK